MFGREGWRRRLRGARGWVLVVGSVLAGDGCGGDGTPGGEASDAGTDTETTASPSGGTIDAPTSTSGGSGGSSPSGPATETSEDTEIGSTTDASTGDTGIDPPGPSSHCADRELPRRDGAEILVQPGDAGMVLVDGQSRTLREVVAGASAGDTVLLADGIYGFPDAGEGQYSGLYVTTADITIRSASGNADAVILDSAYVSHGGSSGVITIDAPGVVLADFTVQRSIFHLVHLWANGDRALLHNVRLIDGGQQFLKSSTQGEAVDGVEVSCSTFLMTDAGRDNVWGYGPQDGQTRCYTGGIDTHEATNWAVRDSMFEGIYCDASGVQRPAHGRFAEMRDNMTYNGGLSEHGVHMWDSVQGTGHVIERNLFINCGRGIGLGFNGEVYGSTVINNMVFSEHAASGEHDVGISVERGVDSVVAHNTVFFSHPDAYANRMEYRFETTSNLAVHGNLTNGNIAARDGAEAATTDNVLEATEMWFQDALGADLHLADCQRAPSAALHPLVTTDFDGAMRSDPTPLGADGCAR